MDCWKLRVAVCNISVSFSTYVEGIISYVSAAARRTPSTPGTALPCLKSGHVLGVVLTVVAKRKII